MNMNFEKQPPSLQDELRTNLLRTSHQVHYACYVGNEQMLDCLLKNISNDKKPEALISESDSLNGWTPAHWAGFYGQLACLMRLHVKPHLGFDHPCPRNTSPLHLAAMSGAVLCLKWLLQCGANYNRQDIMGETPLHKAAKAGNTDTAAMLISHGCSLTLKNHRGLPPSQVAEESGHPTLACYLRRAGEQAEYGGTTKHYEEQHFLPLSELNPSPVVSPVHLSHGHPLAGQHHVTHGHSMHNNLNLSHISMNGEGIHNNNTTTSINNNDSMEMEDSAMQEDVETSIGHMVGSKRPMDSSDDEEYIVEGHKRRCHVQASQLPASQRYGDSKNNNILSSFNSVLAVRLEPMSQHAPPPIPQSSLMEHHASVVAQQGYDSSFMSAFH